MFVYSGICFSRILFSSVDSVAIWQIVNLLYLGGKMAVVVVFVCVVFPFVVAIWWWGRVLLFVF